jgi:hypothetical protein
MSAVNRPDVLAQMPADSIERIEVITNPSAKFKPDGTAGIINLVMKKQHKAGGSGTFRASVGNDSRLNANLSFNYNPGKYNLFGTVSVRQDDRSRFGTERRSHLDVSTQSFLATDQRSSEHMRPVSRLAEFGVDYTLSETDKVGASASYNYRTFFRDGIVTNRSLAANGALTSDYDRTRADDEWQKTYEVKATYTHTFAEDHELSIEAKRDRHWEQENNLYTNAYRVGAALPSGRHSYQADRDRPRIDRRLFAALRARCEARGGVCRRGEQERHGLPWRRVRWGERDLALGCDADQPVYLPRHDSRRVHDLWASVRAVRFSRGLAG